MDNWEAQLDAIEAPHDTFVAPLALEWVGEDSDSLMRGFDGSKPIRKPWVARITGHDPKFGWAREFINGQKRYDYANSSCSRGVTLHFWLTRGVYEIRAFSSWRREDRYFARVAFGRIRRIDPSEVAQCLANAPSA